MFIFFEGRAAVLKLSIQIPISLSVATIRCKKKNQLILYKLKLKPTVTNINLTYNNNFCMQLADFYSRQFPLKNAHAYICVYTHKICLIASVHYLWKIPSVVYVTEMISLSCEYFFIPLLLQKETRFIEFVILALID